MFRSIGFSWACVFVLCSALAAADQPSADELAPVVLRDDARRCICFSPEGKSLAFSLTCNLRIAVPEAPNEQPAAPPKVLGGGEKETVRGMMLSPDSKLLATISASNAIKLWDISTKELKTTIETGKYFWAERLAFSSDGNKLAAAGRSRLRVFDLETTEAVHDFSDHRLGECLGLGFLPDGDALIALFRDRNIRLWNLKTGNQENDWKLQTYVFLGSVMAVAPDGKSFAVSDWRHSSIVFYESATGAELAAIGRPKKPMVRPEDEPPGIGRGDPAKEKPLGSPVRTLVYSFDGKMLACGRENGQVHVFDVEKRSELAVLQYPQTHFTRAASDIALSRDNKLLTVASAENQVLVFDLAAKKQVLNLEAKEHAVSGVTFSGDGKELITCARANVQFWDYQQLLKEDAAAVKPLMVLSRDLAPCVSYAPDGRSFAVGYSGGRIQVYDAETREEKLAIAQDERDRAVWIQQAAWSSDGKKLAALVGRSKLRVFDAKKGELLCEFEGHVSAEKGLAFIDEDSLITASEGRTVRLWSMRTGKEIGEWKPQDPPKEINAFAISPDRKTFAVDDWKTSRILLYDVGSGARVNILNAPKKSTVETLAFSADGKLLACGAADGTCLVYDVSTRKEVLTVICARITHLVFSHDSKRLAIVEFGDTVRIYDIAAKKELASIDADRRSVHWVIFSPDGKELITSGHHRSMVCVWDLEKLMKQKPKK